MSAKILAGKEFAAEFKAEAKEKAAALKEKYGVAPGLAVVIVGEDPASQVYVRNKHKACEELGIYSEVVALPETITADELTAKIDELNADEKIHGILVQLPLPKNLRQYEEDILARISPLKDVDGFHPVNVGKLSLGQPGLVPCTPLGCLKMLELAGIEIAGKRAVIIGRSNIVGKPMAALMLKKDATVTICHSRTADLKAVCKEADILISAIGKPKFVTADMVKDGAVLIDVGINRMENGKLCGDVDFDAVKEKASFITPVPGGCGPMTIAMLMQNTLTAYDLQQK